LLLFLSPPGLSGLMGLFEQAIGGGLARWGGGWSRGYARAGEASRMEEVVQAALKLSQRRHGALIVLERTADLEEIGQGGVKIDADVSEEMLRSILRPGSPLPDGAVVCSITRIASPDS